MEFVGYKDGASQGTVLASTTLRNGAASAKWQPVVADKWLRDGSPIPGATHSVYTFHSVDYGHWITCQVTASNSASHVTVFSADLVAP